MLLNGAEVLRMRGGKIAATIAMAKPELPDTTNDPAALGELDALHREQFREFLGRMPAVPSEQMNGARPLVLVVEVDDRKAGVGFHLGDDLVIELVEREDVQS